MSTFRSERHRLDFEESVPVVRVPMGVRSPVVLGIVAILLAIGGFGVWAATAPLSSAVVAAGKLVVASKRKQIQHLEGGILHRLLVKDGDRVAEGDVLLELDLTRSRSRYAMARLGFVGAAAAEARLAAERDDLSEVVFARSLLEEVGTDAEARLLLDNQRETFRVRQKEYRGQVEILEQRRNRLQDETRGLEAERSAAHEQLGLAEEEHATLDKLYKQALTTRQRVLALAREVVQLRGQIGRLTSRIAAAEKEGNEVELNLAQLKIRRNSEVLVELKDVQAKMLDFRQHLAAYRHELDRTVVRAPVSGTIVSLQIHTIGGVVRPGDTLLEIVPDRDSLVVEIKVRPLDIDNVHVGQETEVRFSGLNRQTTPEIRGRVSTISADAISDPKQQEPYYLADIEIGIEQAPALAGLPLQAGMPCEVMINTGERTALSYFMKPILDSLRRAMREG